MYREIMLRNKSIFQISTLLCLSSISICNLLIDLPSYLSIFAEQTNALKTFIYKNIYATGCSNIELALKTIEDFSSGEVLPLPLL
jgi:hypothetical protein